MASSVKAILMELIEQAILEGTNPTRNQLAVMVQNHPEYGDRKTKGVALEREINRYLDDAYFISELRSKFASQTDDTIFGLQLGKLEIRLKR
ncbi:MAG: hypothetical protein ACLPVI_11775 [Dehalococcoidales bacterium]